MNTKKYSYNTPNKKNLVWFLFSIKGRINRKDFWIFTAISAVIIWGTEIISGGDIGLQNMSKYTWIVIILLFWPMVAVHAKRWHDIDRSAWWLLLGFIPFLNIIFSLIVPGFFKGTIGINRFGSSDI